LAERLRVLDWMVRGQILAHATRCPAVGNCVMSSRADGRGTNRAVRCGTQTVADRRTETFQEEEAHW